MHHLNLKTQLKKNSGTLKDTFDFIPLHLVTFQGDVVQGAGRGFWAGYVNYSFFPSPQLLMRQSGLLVSR